MAKIVIPLVLAGTLTASPLHAQYTYYPDYNYGNGNGYRVYLSAATHSPDRGSCLSTQGVQSATENDLGWATSISATDGFSDNDDIYPNTYDLTERGYTVQIGYATYQEKVNQSNAWGAHMHLPVHSNAVGDVANCNTATTSAGMWGMYKPNNDNSYRLAYYLHYYLSPVTPGTRDRLDTINNFTGGTLYETERTTAGSTAYLEQEFHTSEAGSRWMYYDLSWQHKIAGAIDYHFGSPR